MARLFVRRRDVLEHVEVRDLSERAVVKLATERKHLTDIIKMIAIRRKAICLSCYDHTTPGADQEGRTLLHELFATANDIRVSDSELNMTFSPLSSPHRT